MRSSRSKAEGRGPDLRSGRASRPIRPKQCFASTPRRSGPRRRAGDGFIIYDDKKQRREARGPCLSSRTIFATGYPCCASRTGRTDYLLRRALSGPPVEADSNSASIFSAYEGSRVLRPAPATARVAPSGHRLDPTTPRGSFQSNIRTDSTEPEPTDLITAEKMKHKNSPGPHSHGSFSKEP